MFHSRFNRSRYVWEHEIDQQLQPIAANGCSADLCIVMEGESPLSEYSIIIWMWEAVSFFFKLYPLVELKKMPMFNHLNNIFAFVEV